MFFNLIKLPFRNLLSKIYNYSKIYSDAYLINSYLKQYNISTVIDIGANSGQYAISLRRFGYKKKIISFEPQKKPYNKLLKNAANDEKWIIHERVAIGQKNKTEKIYNSKNSLSSSIKRINNLHVSAEPKSKIIGSEKIIVIKLDEIFNQYYKKNDNILLKIDTQGYEYEVLNGALRSLKNIKLIQVELSFLKLFKNQLNWLDILCFLEKKNFRVIKCLDGFKDKKNNEVLQIDCILKNNKL